LETDRRLIKKKINRLKKELEEVRRHRTLYRRQRQKQGIPVIPIIGYTNAGKSTLFNALCKAEAFVEDKLFATLDPTTRRLVLPDKRIVLLTDTVGFIQKLPPTVVAAFRATLEELEEATLLIHIVDIAHQNALEQYYTVERILKELRLDHKPQILALNKLDLLEQGQRIKIKEERPEGITISATKGWGLTQLIQAISEKLLCQGRRL
jgi:GTP-binding protein HflX